VGFDWSLKVLLVVANDCVHADLTPWSHGYFEAALWARSALALTETACVHVAMNQDPIIEEEEKYIKYREGGRGR
jgi:hypothetical protein